MEVVNNPLWAKILDISIALFVIFTIAVAEGVVIWKLWQQNKSHEQQHAKDLQLLNDGRLLDAQSYATNREKATEQNQAVLEQLNRVLTHMNSAGSVDEKVRRMLLAICEKLELPLKDFI